jgi:glycosyltransferase involved in cell wall biosynthesis
MVNLRQFKRRAVDWLRGETEASFFDIRVGSRELKQFLGHWGLVESSPTASGNKAYRVYELREDLRQAFPLAFTPAGRRDFLAWFINHGMAEFGVSIDEVLAALREQDASPNRGLFYSYRLQPDWQARFPNAFTTEWSRFKDFLRDTFSLNCRWLKSSAPNRSERHSSVSEGVNIVAHFRYASGLQEAALGIAEGFHRAGRPVARRDLPVIFPCDWADTERYVDLEDHDVSIYVAAVNTFQSEWYRRAGLHPRPGVKRVAVWYWELEQVPTEWHEHLQWADEVWAPTRFIAEAFRSVVKCPVRPMLPGVSLPTVTPLPRSHFGLPEDRFLFLFNFDMGSVMARKNPLAAIDAFRRAFHADDRAHFAIKVSRGESRPDDYRRLRQAAADAGVTLINRVLPRSELLALLNTADCYVSLHRSEGLGLGMAESMLMGKPVIATGYSGNMDFMTPDTAKLVPYRLIPIESESTVNNPYPKGCLWADADVDAAAAMMRELANAPPAARELGRRAQASAHQRLSPDSYSHRLCERLDAIRKAG